VKQNILRIFLLHLLALTELNGHRSIDMNSTLSLNRQNKNTTHSVMSNLSQKKAHIYVEP
jgi:hypothetical protein